MTNISEAFSMFQNKQIVNINVHVRYEDYIAIQRILFLSVCIVPRLSTPFVLASTNVFGLFKSITDEIRLDAAENGVDIFSIVSHISRNILTCSMKFSSNCIVVLPES